MNEYQLRKLLENSEILNEKIKAHTQNKLITTQPIENNEISGHIDKSEHNLRFITDTLEKKYTDWAITGCYYAAYHAALALILKKGYYSKNHDATLCILIKEYYKQGIDKEDIELINRFFLDYQDLLFYIQAKTKREEASYSSKRIFDKKKIENLRLKTILFINKVKEMLK